MNNDLNMPDINFGLMIKKIYHDLSYCFFLLKYPYQESSIWNFCDMEVSILTNGKPVHHLIPEISKWLNEHVTDNWQVFTRRELALINNELKIENLIIGFKRPEDATAFKLTWL